MGYRKLDQVLVYDHLKEGYDPTYDWDEPNDTWYLGLAGELASEIKCSKISLPMLSRETYNWEKQLTAALKEAASLRPQRHVDNFNHACSEFSKEMFKKGLNEERPSIWFSNTETRKTLKSQIKYDKHNHYNNNHYEVDRCYLELDLPQKVIAFVPSSDYFGCLAINEDFFNFFFFQENIQLYYLRELKIGKNDPDA